MFIIARLVLWYKQMSSMLTMFFCCRDIYMYMCVMDIKGGTTEILQFYDLSTFRKQTLPVDHGKIFTRLIQKNKSFERVMVFFRRVTVQSF